MIKCVHSEQKNQQKTVSPFFKPITMQEDQNPISNYRNSPKRYFVFLSSLFATCSFMGLIGAYAMLKKYLADEIGIEESELGVLDGAKFFIRSLTCLYLIFKPITYARKSYLIHSTSVAIIMLMIPFTPLLGSYAYVAIVILFLLSGIGRAFNFIPQFVVNQYFEADGRDLGKMRIWISFSGYGDIIAILSMHLFLNSFHWNWKVCLWVAAATFLLLSIAFIISIDQIKTHNNGPIQEGREQSLSWSSQQVKNFIMQPSNFLWLLNVSFFISSYFSCILWIPYFFQKKGFVEQAAFISIGLGLIVPLGAILFNVISSRFPTFKAQLINICILMVAMLFLSMALIQKKESLIGIYFTILLMCGFFIAGPYSNMESTETRQRAPSVRQFYHALLLTKFSYQMFVVIEMIIFGYLMQKDLEWLFYCLAIMFGISLILNIIRNILYPIQPATQHRALDQE